MKLNELLAEINRLQKSHELLESVWAHMDPYTGQTDLPEYVRHDLQDHFKWDDSE